MKKINDFWVDEHNNKWNCATTTREQAIRNSENLIHCTDCTNCISCADCTGCRYCIECSCCRNCVGCTCCSYCISCKYSTNCTNCTDCKYCKECVYCTDYTETPMQYRTNKIGSRHDNTVFYYGKTEDGMSLQVICGCFRGNLEEFENAVLKTHANRDLYRNQYLNEIDKVKMLFELE